MGMAMDLKVVDEKENKLLARRELLVDLLHSGEATPSRANVQQLVAKMLSSDPEATEIREIRSGKGEATSRVRVYVWKEKKVGLHTKKEKAAQKEAKLAESTPAQK